MKVEKKDSLTPSIDINNIGMNKPIDLVIREINLIR